MANLGSHPCADDNRSAAARRHRRPRKHHVRQLRPQKPAVPAFGQRRRHLVNRPRLTGQDGIVYLQPISLDYTRIDRNTVTFFQINYVAIDKVGSRHSDFLAATQYGTVARNKPLQGFYSLFCLALLPKRKSRIYHNDDEHRNP